MPDSARDTAEALLDAQVAFHLAQLRPDAFGPLLESEVDAVLADAAVLPLGQVVSREQIKAVARKYAVSTHIPGSIPELANEIADRVYNHPAQDATRLHDVLATQQVEAFAEKLMELPLVQERLLESPLVVEILAEMLYKLASDAVVTQRELASKIPGVGSLLGAGTSLLNSVAGNATRDLEVRLQEISLQAARIVLRRAKGSVLSPEDPWIQASVVGMWRENADRPISSLRDYVREEDLEDLFVLLYDFWLSFRETDYLHALIDAGVDFFFDKYEDTTLLALAEEFGVGRADIMEEARRFAPPIIAVLSENGMLEAILRRRLEPFYRSEPVRALLKRS